MLESCDTKEYSIVKKLYGGFAKKVFPENPMAFWYFFGCEHDQDPFLLSQSE
ncbi:hypothetical protein MAL08_07970 [Leptospira noguchii]|uniref:hypothetical protein n=1 Tax=Leptospira noguchii TaxID=28182 RepID=UPI0002BF4DAF|nr:hypothetical protein [Leptospira noguchii]EMI70827.1 hypothetical protein LEP1GSC072_1652 [Leptospira noguchii str. Bonito]EMS89016.1 hypothetical protein LEP1GSC073_2196 [Leptospira noguchii str. Cascata]UOG39186.1 hypothetical protein MAL08_07970 [Leptospira noguchii]